MLNLTPCLPSAPAPQITGHTFRASGVAVEWRCSQQPGPPVRRFEVSWKLPEWWTSEKVSIPVTAGVETYSYHIPNIPPLKEVQVWVRSVCEGGVVSSHAGPVSVVRGETIFTFVYDGNIEACNKWLAEQNNSTTGGNSNADQQQQQRNVLGCVDEDGTSLAHWAAWRGKVNSMSWIIEHGGDVGMEVNGLKPIHWACVQKHLPGRSPDIPQEDILECVRLLIETTKCGPDCPTSKGRTLLMLCEQSKMPQLVTFLLSIGARTDLKDENGDTILHWAAFMGDTALVEKLCVTHKMSPLDVDNEGQTPLHLAATCGHASTARFLANLGKRQLINIKDNRGQTALELAFAKQAHDTVEELLEVVLDNLRCRLILFYAKVNPVGLDKVDELAEYFIHNEEDLNNELQQKYQTSLEDPSLYHPSTWTTLANRLMLFAALVARLEVPKILEQFGLAAEGDEGQDEERMKALNDHLEVVYGHDLRYITEWLDTNFAYEMEHALANPVAPTTSPTPAQNTNTEPTHAAAAAQEDQQPAAAADADATNTATAQNDTDDSNSKQLTHTLKVEGMMCNTSCTPRVKKALEAIDGVSSVTVDLDTKTAVVAGEVSDVDLLIQTVNQLGFQASLGDN